MPPTEDLSRHIVPRPDPGILFEVILTYSRVSDTRSTLQVATHFEVSSSQGTSWNEKNCESSMHNTGNRRLQTVETVGSCMAVFAAGSSSSQPQRDSEQNAVHREPNRATVREHLPTQLPLRYTCGARAPIGRRLEIPGASVARESSPNGGDPCDASSKA